ncbi:alkaline-phosphatase-like protein [Cantharellus anzutake]|uniref:alkaline-phosphatase-like protein n=1 Tax=Cantharellus anzutake TaxID=1750568 RepID=UPI0019085A35|nr:alkaline-phosphatase-like protein [Cantharellus anzutake]KAF8338761.1 alkaline-phosphatase-like protein [Cantharellus anzutake]
MPVEHDLRLWNGTQFFRRTVLMVSIDGLRADYVERGLTPHLLNISHQGLRAKFLKPVFPIIVPSYPRSNSFRTGLYAESHGMVANNFYDPITNTSFHYADSNTVYNASWWWGEPIWETVSKAGLTTANLMWPGPLKTIRGISPTYMVPWRDHVPLQEKHDQIMEWIDLPLEKRPQLILAYEPHLDQVGHKAGPESNLVNSVLGDVDKFAASIHASLKQRNLTQIVDVIFVSDHGMTNTSNTRLVYLDDVMGKDQVAEIEHEDGWPSVGLWMSKASNLTQVLLRLLSSNPATSNPPAINVYTAKSMPARYHFNPDRNPRIAPLWIVPHIGWAITNHHEHEVVMAGNYKPKGVSILNSHWLFNTFICTNQNHGYDNDESSMHAFFVADGPFATRMRKKRFGGFRDYFPRSPSSAMLDRHTNLDEQKDPMIIEGFENVEIYGLVCRLLGIERFAAPNNGTPGFWDRYLEDGH